MGESWVNEYEEYKYPADSQPSKPAEPQAAWFHLDRTSGRDRDYLLIGQHTAAVFAEGEGISQDGGLPGEIAKLGDRNGNVSRRF